MSSTPSQNNPIDPNNNNNNNSNSNSNNNNTKNNNNKDNVCDSPPFHHSPKPHRTPKKLDLESYFDDLPHPTPPRRSKPVYITRPVRKALRFRRLCKPRRRNIPFSVPTSRDEQEYIDEEDEECSESEEDDEWVKTRWNALLDRQRLLEADVRRTILSRNRLNPSELSRWLDSDDTCTLPLPNLGVRLRMVEQ